jgi:hypothetical protein
LALELVFGAEAEDEALEVRQSCESKRAVLARFPYAVRFRVTDAQVVVLAIHV